MALSDPRSGRRGYGWGLGFEVPTGGTHRWQAGNGVMKGGSEMTRSRPDKWVVSIVTEVEIESGAIRKWGNLVVCRHRSGACWFKIWPS